MKRLLILTFICLISAFVKVQGKSSSTPIIYIDGNGVMRWSDTRREASFFGVNYTLPFAHAYRAIGYLELDRKAAIDKDVYHISRLGLNAYRIHLWDVELTDGQGKSPRKRASRLDGLPDCQTQRTQYSYCDYRADQLRERISRTKHTDGRLLL